jgi:hypothetical protein
MPDTRASASVQLADAAVWFAIAYLDSDTEFREYLPLPKQSPSRPENKLVFLDDIPISKWAVIKAMTLVVILACIFLCLFLRN